MGSPEALAIGVFVLSISVALQGCGTPTVDVQIIDSCQVLSSFYNDRKEMWVQEGISSMRQKGLHEEKVDHAADKLRTELQKEMDDADKACWKQLNKGIEALNKHMTKYVKGFE